MKIQEQLDKKAWCQTHNLRARYNYAKDLFECVEDNEVIITHREWLEMNGHA